MEPQETIQSPLPQKIHSREPGVSGNFLGSHEGCQVPFRPSGRNRGLPLLPSVHPLSRASVPSPRHPSISRVPVSSPRWSWASVPPPGGHGHPSPLLLTGAPTPGSPWPVSGHPPLALIVTLGLGTPCHPQCRCTWSSKGKCHWARCWGQSTLATNAWLPSPADHASGWIMPGGCLFARAGQGWGALEGPGPLGTACAPPGPGCLQALINSPGFAGRVHGCG